MLIDMDFNSGGSGGKVQYALSFSHYYASGGYGSYIGFLYDTEGNRVDNTAKTIENDYVRIVLSGNSSSESITVTAKKAGYYNVLGHRYDNASYDIPLTREYKNIGDTVYTRTSSSATRVVYIIIWLEA